MTEPGTWPRIASTRLPPVRAREAPASTCQARTHYQDGQRLAIERDRHTRRVSMGPLCDPRDAIRDARYLDTSVGALPAYNAPSTGRPSALDYCHGHDSHDEASGVDTDHRTDKAYSRLLPWSRFSRRGEVVCAPGTVATWPIVRQGRCDSQLGGLLPATCTTRPGARAPDGSGDEEVRVDPPAPADHHAPRHTSCSTTRVRRGCGGQ